MRPGASEFRGDASHRGRDGSRGGGHPHHSPERFLASGGLTLGDGTTISAEQMWRFLTEEMPRRRFASNEPHDRTKKNRRRDFEFVAGLKQRYWHMTSDDRFLKKVASGRPVTVVQEGSPREIYSAAGCIAVHPNYPVAWRLRQMQDLTREERTLQATQISDEFKRTMATECCANVAPFAAAQSSGAPIHFIATMMTTRCSDGVYAIEATMRQGLDVPCRLIDFPVQSSAGAWRVDYLAKQYRQLAAQLGELTGKPLSDEALLAEIRRRNELRQLAREAYRIWWSAPKPPVRMGFATEGDTEDVSALKQLLQENIAEQKARVVSGVGAPNLAPDPLRIFVCGSCANVDGKLLDQSDAAIIGQEEQLCNIAIDVKEEGDPYVNLAEAACQHPYELPPEERAAWTARKITEARADGVIFVYSWGCNYQSGVSRLLTDVIREKSGVPTLTLDVSRCGGSERNEQNHTRIQAFLEMLQHNRKTPAATDSAAAPSHREAEHSADRRGGRRRDSL